jgi:hypothetical protein
MPIAPEQVCFDPTMVDAGASEPDAGATVDGCHTGIAAEDDIRQAMPTGDRFFVIQSGPTRQGNECCYVVQPQFFCEGRPFLVDHRSLVATPRLGDRGYLDTELPRPRTDDLPADLCAALAQAWTRAGLAEHASVASFGRFALELLAAGAPADLVVGAHLAAVDEVRHTRLCLALAAAYAREPVGPGRFPFDGNVEVTSDLATIAARAAREGCIGETIAAVQAAEQHARATDPAVRAALAIIAEDEARHAELAWRTVAWAVQEGGERVRAAVAAVLAEGERVGNDGPPSHGALDAHGQLDAQEQRRVANQAIAEVVRPAARVLLRQGDRPARDSGTGEHDAWT